MKSLAEERLIDEIWDELPRLERIWRAQAWGWNYYIEPEREAELRSLGDRGYRLLEANDLVAPWTPELMFNAWELTAMFGLEGEEPYHSKIEALRAKFLAAGIDSMECFFEREEGGVQNGKE